MEIFLVGMGGILGAVTRCFLGRLIAANSKWPFPWGTLFVNLSGAYFLSFLAFNKIILASTLKLFLMTGFLGAYTTFSTFSYESLVLLKNKEYLKFLTYIILTLVGGIIASYSGLLSA